LTWDWWTQGAIPILLGVISIGVAIVALVVAVAANNHAKAANATAQAAIDLSRHVADREAREREDDRERVLREKRSRIVREINEEYSQRMRKRPHPTEDDAYARMLQVAVTVRDACRREGLTAREDQPIMSWLLRAHGEVATGIQREGETDAPLVKRSFTLRGWRVLGTTLRRELEVWQQTGTFNTARTVEEMMPRVHFPKKDGDLANMAAELRAEKAVRPATSSGDQQTA
jgi:hypothetical protein